MHTHSKKPENPEIQIHFIKQQKLKQQTKLQNKLHLQILRVKAAEKQSLIYQIQKMDQNQLCQFFDNYQMFPQVLFTLEELKQSQIVKLIRNKGKVYFGEVVNRQMSGIGVCYYPEGKVYEGTFSDNKKQGVGCQIYQNGNLYIGEFVNNKKHGKGQFFWFSVNTSQKLQHYEYYDGQWWGGLPDGKGIHQKANGDHYQGTFKNGLKHGYGQQSYGNGDYYQGQYINGLPEGIGTYSWSDGSFYKGDFKQGLRNGYGLWKMSKNDNSQKYQGHYLMDKKSGYGQYTWSNGWIYKGNFDNDKRQGYGQLYDYNACVFKGQWVKGQKFQKIPSNIVKISRVIQKHNIRYIQKDQFQIQDIHQTVNLTQKPYLQKYKEHELLTRPGFLIRRSVKCSINLDKNSRATSRYRSSRQKNHNLESESASTLTSRIGTAINRPISKNLFQTTKNLKISKVRS